LSEHSPDPRRTRILAISSGGGHWVQLLRLRPAFEGHDVAYATVDRRYASEVEGQRFHLFKDATAWSKTGLLIQLWQVFVILLRERPDVVVTTGASAGFFALALAKLMRARTIWLDSIANTEALSSSGRKARRCADLYLTQWPHLAEGGAVEYRGAVL
jgi:UDP-N-acetylglucosamine:LPS N-acetylglucosamine transferase